MSVLQNSMSVVFVAMAHPVTKDRLPTVIVLFLFMVAISVAECLVCLLGGDL